MDSRSSGYGGGVRRPHIAVQRNAANRGFVIMTIARTASPTPVHTYTLTQSELIVEKMVGLIGLASANACNGLAFPSSASMAAMERAIEAYVIAPGQWRQKLEATSEPSGRPLPAVFQSGISSSKARLRVDER